MKPKRFLTQLGLLAALLAVLHSPLTTAFAQGTAFTYQGRLDDNGTPAGGVFDLRFRLFNAVSGGSQLGSLVVEDVPVTNGLFTVTLDFGAEFPGGNRWLQIAVRPGASTGSFTIVDPRQAVTPVPYAIYSGGADAGGVTGTLPDARLSANVALRNSVNTFTAKQAITNSAFTAIFSVANPSGAFTYDGFPPSGQGDALLGAFTAAGTNWPQLRFTRATGGSFMDIGQNGAGDFVVEGSDTPRLVVQNGGNVGIGTSTPTARLEVAGTVKATAFVGNTFTGNQLITSGNVGIGTATPATALHVTGPGDTEISLESLANGRRWTLQATDNGPSWAGAFQIIDRTVQAARLLITTNGSVGIGTSTPATQLDVAGTVRATAFDGPLSATNVTSGTLPDARLSSGVARRNGGNTFTGNQFITSGNVGIGTATPGARLEVSDGSIGLQFIPGQLNGVNDPNAVTLDIPGAKTLGVLDNLVVANEVTTTAINITSDRHAKEEFTPVNARAILAKVAALPITEWQYKTQGDARHIGPMAQDFRAAFGTGRDDRHITTVDADGVALAAIQGLNEVVQEKDAELSRLKAENESLARRLAQIERALGLQK